MSDPTRPSRRRLRPRGFPEATAAASRETTRSASGSGTRGPATAAPPEPLTVAEEEELEADLRALLRELEAAVKGATRSAATVDLDQPIGRVSRVDALQQQQMAKASLERQRTRLLQARQALRALEEGDYGECRACDDPIGYKRLKARPESPFCMGCQAEREGR